jgi:hypothetical protein
LRPRRVSNTTVNETYDRREQRYSSLFHNDPIVSLLHTTLFHPTIMTTVFDGVRDYAQHHRLFVAAGLIVALPGAVLLILDTDTAPYTILSLLQPTSSSNILRALPVQSLRTPLRVAGHQIASSKSHQPLKSTPHHFRRYIDMHEVSARGLGCRYDSFVCASNRTEIPVRVY